jgi:ligand-binding sensor domain-containing protein
MKWRETWFNNSKNDLRLYFLSVFLILFLLYSSGLLIGQNENIRFDHITRSEGLSQNTVYCILQDSNGFMWFGTQDGLNRYDGRSFIVYDHHES